MSVEFNEVTDNSSSAFMKLWRTIERGERRRSFMFDACVNECSRYTKIGKKERFVFFLKKAKTKTVSRRMVFLMKRA